MSNKLDLRMILIIVLALSVMAMSLLTISNGSLGLNTHGQHSDTH